MFWLAACEVRKARRRWSLAVVVVLLLLLVAMAGLLRARRRLRPSTGAKMG